MSTYCFRAGDMIAEHRHLSVNDIHLEVLAAAEGEEPRTSPSALLTGPMRVNGRLVLECVPGGNRLRPGMQAELRLSTADYRYTRLQVLILEPLGIETPRPGLRRYRWSFLVVGRSSMDPVGLFPKSPPAATAAAPAIRPRTAGKEVSLEELLEQLGSKVPVLEGTAVRFNSEGGFVVEEPTGGYA
jgi:hypothetical protein